jgi:hypothetical protein
MRQSGMRQNGVRHSGMRHFTTPPISCQFLLTGGSIGPRYVLQLLFSEKSQNC